mmetsp:Transcript_21889/g.45181  ORF Transcript_21889/g.45181 Transcript_21889/m.45181 type:complete len:333 (-) Transcript_21889:70-1068(-)
MPLLAGRCLPAGVLLCWWSLVFAVLNQFAEDVDSQALLSIHPPSDAGLDDHNARLLRCAKAPPGDALCFDTPAPPEFSVRFQLHDGRSFRVKSYSHWAPVFVQRFWQLSKLSWWRDVAIYRNVYVNETLRFVSQFGLVGTPSVNSAWVKWKTNNQTSPALKSNTRGRVSFSMDAVICKEGEPEDPCKALRPNCTAEDYCAVGFFTEIYVNFADNSRLDPHGFAPIGEVDEGMEVLDDLAQTLGNRYGEVQDLCPPTPPKQVPLRRRLGYCTHAVQRRDRSQTYCIYRNGKCAGVNETKFHQEGNVYIKNDFPQMFRLRIKDAQVESFTKVAA